MKKTYIEYWIARMRLASYSQWIIIIISWLHRHRQASRMNAIVHRIWILLLHLHKMDFQLLIFSFIRFSFLASKLNSFSLLESSARALPICICVCVWTLQSDASSVPQWLFTVEKCHVERCQQLRYCSIVCLWWYSGEVYLCALEKGPRFKEML